MGVIVVHFRGQRRAHAKAPDLTPPLIRALTNGDTRRWCVCAWPVVNALYYDRYNIILAWEY